MGRRRLSNSGLTSPRAATPAEIVGHHGAVQTQDYAPAKWSVGQRARGLTDDDLDQALADGSIVRTHVLRPTWHLVAGTDLRWLQELTGPRVRRHNAPRYRELGLDAKVLARSAAVISSALSEAKRLTRKEIAAILEARRIDASGQRIAYIVMHCELEALICSGGLAGKQHTYALVDEHLPPAPQFDRDGALVELVRRYLQSHGPATVGDLGWWSSLTVADLKEGLSLLGTEVRSETIAAVEFWTLARESPAPRPRGIHLLQAYDEIVVGYSKSRFFGDPRAAELMKRRRERHVPTGIVLFEGKLAGNWRRSARADSVTVELDLFDALPPRGRGALEAARAELQRFLGREVRMGAAGTT